MIKKSIKHKVKKDKKRSFDKKQKEYMYRVQRKLCRVCGKYFPLTMLEGAHYKGHAKKGKTQVENGYLACPNCHTSVDKGLTKINGVLPDKKEKKSKKNKKSSKKKDILNGMNKKDPLKNKKIPDWL